MKKYFQFWFVWLCSVLIAFTLQQVLFLAYNYKQLSGVSFIEIIESFWVARKLNYAMFCYTSAIPFLIYIIQLNTTKQLLRLFMLSYASAIFIIFFSLSTAELSLYQEWGSKLNFKALNYLKNPSEIIHTASLSFALLFILLVVLQTLLSLYFLKKYLPSPLPSINGRWNNKAGYSLINFIVGLFLIVIGLRGGLQQIPINQSVSYFSKHNILNLAATNTVFNAIHSVLQNKKTTNTNIYKVLDNNEAVTIVKKMHTPLKDTTLFFLKNNRPNIFIFLLEGWAGDAVGACNGDSSLTPFINQIANKGINFERCYASGNRSDQGIAAVFSSFPAQSLTSIIEQPDKFSKLPSLTKTLAKEGYSTQFYFGGQLSYANIESYMIYNQTDKIIDSKQLTKLYPTGRLGVHDEYVLDYISKDLKNIHQPFFTTFFTGSTHAPYDIPNSPKRKWGTDMDDYANSIIYADSCINNFFVKNKNENWFKNTLFIFISDHCHMTHRWYDYHDMLNHQVPFIFYGDVIKDECKGKNYNYVVSQTDLAATLLAQLNINYDTFTWSKNLMNPTYSRFAFYSFPQGGGWVNDTNAFSYNYALDKFEWKNIKDTSTVSSQLKQFKAYMQVMFQQYLDY